MRHANDRGAHRAQRGARWGWMTLAGLALALFLLVVLAASASAAPQRAPDIPLVEVCPKEAPFARTPESGLAGLLGERPLRITTDNSPEHIWSTGGFAGLRAHTYDLGCAIDPTSWMRVANASTDAKIANVILSVGDATVSLTDSIDRRSWQPGWVVSFLEDFVARASRIIDSTIIVPFLGLGLIAATGLGLYRAHRGDIGSAATDTGWIFVVITVSALLLLSPLIAAKVGQTAVGAMVSALNESSNPTDGATNQIVKNVQYQGWLRRNFGNAESAAAETYGPALLASTRISWAELDQINALERDERPEAIKKLTDLKAEQFKAIAGKVENADPIAYRHLTGKELGSIETLVELLFVFAACFFRIATAILIITCTITLALLAIIWLVATPILPLPRVGRFSGQEMGMGLVNSAVRATVYVLMAALGSWLFGIYLQACMAPGMSLWWSLLLLLIGSGIAWTLIRPDRKFLSIVSLGRIQGYGYVGSLIKGLLMAYVGGRVAGGAAADERDREPEPVQERLSEDVHTQPRTVYANVYNPTRPFVPERPTHVDGEPIVGSVINALPAYERPVSNPSPPPDRAESPYQPYERSDDSEGART